jgi:lysozyme
MTQESKGFKKEEMSMEQIIAMLKKILEALSKSATKVPVDEHKFGSKYSMSQALKPNDVTSVKESEGLRLEAYKPTKHDVWTIGWGHTKGVFPGQVITEEEAEEFLAQDLAWVRTAIDNQVDVPLTQNMYDALVSFVFNLGEANFASSTLLKKLNSKDYKGAANELPRWNKQRNKRTGVMEPLTGLTIRRAKERDLFLKGM